MESYTALAATVVSILVPFLAKGAEEFVKGAGKDTYEKTKAFYDHLKKRFAADKEATTTLALFENKPERHSAALESILEEELEKDSVFAAELSDQVNALGPYIEVIQKMKSGQHVTGLEADEVRSGQMHVDQEIDDAKDVKGVVVKKIG